MGRPTDWAPLAACDPVPGDPDEITTEANRLKRVAADMRDQIARLRLIAEERTLTGQYAGKLRHAAGDLAEKLERTVGRYEEVAGHLTAWAPELAFAQAESVKALERARAAEATRNANAVFAIALGESAPPTGPEAEAAERRRQAALTDAAHELQAARDQLVSALRHVHDKGGTCARRVRDAIDDSVTDSWWDNVKDFVDRNAGWIKTLTEVLGKITTVLAIVAIFVPGLNLLVLGLSLIVFAGHLALALSGSGSWFDVGLDVFALATFGAATAISRGMRSTQQATRTAGAGAARKARYKSEMVASRAERTAAGNTLSNPAASAAAKTAARNRITQLKNEARDAGARAARETREAPVARPNAAQNWAAKDPRTSASYGDISTMRTRFPGDAGVIAASSNTDKLYRAGQLNWRAGIAADFGDKTVDIAVHEEYENLKRPFVHEVGSTW